MKYYLSILFISAVMLVNAQQTTDVLFLKNGSVIKGRIVEKTAEKTKIETCCGIILAYTPSEIEKTEILNEPLPGYLKSKGYYNYTSMGFLIGANNNDKQNIFSVLMEHNYQFNSNFGAGAVVGVEFFNESVAPVGLNLKGLIPIYEGKTMLFANVSGGYSIPLEEVDLADYYEYKDTKGGIFGSADAGIILPSKSNLNMYISLGYRYNELNYTLNNWYYDEVKRKVTYNRFSVKFGIVLH